MANPWNDISEFEQKRVTSETIVLILDTLKDIKEDIREVKRGQKDIREDIRNKDKLRALRK